MIATDQTTVHPGDSVRIRGESWMTVSEVTEVGAIGIDEGQKSRAIRWERISKHKQTNDRRTR